MSGFDFGALKRLARQRVHQTFAVPALYTDGIVTDVPVTVRWHNKLIRPTNPEAAGYAEVIEGVNKLVFNRLELNAVPLVLAQGGVVVIAEYGGASFTLDTLDPPDGPVEICWNVVKADT